jgi:uncharacterized protein
MYEAEGLVAMSHFKLHEMAGFGGAMKNLCMGGASRKGKMAQHSNISPVVTEKSAPAAANAWPTARWRPSSINPETEKAVIDPKKCVGCAECISVCPYGNIQIQWNETIPVFLKKMMEYAYGVMLNKRDRALFINFVTQVSPACDCYGHNDFPIVGDIGILASRPGGHRPGLRRPGESRPRGFPAPSSRTSPPGWINLKTFTPRSTGPSSWNTPSNWAWGPGSMSW